jgi:hypothetical protein
MISNPSSSASRMSRSTRVYRSFIEDARHGPAVGNSADLEILALQVIGEHLANFGVVIDDKDMLRRRCLFDSAFRLLFVASVLFG